MMIDSERMQRRNCRRVVPTARSSPISLVRSYTESASVLAIPIRAMMIARASITVTSPRRASSSPAKLSLYSWRSWMSGLPMSAVSAPSSDRTDATDAPSATFTYISE